MADLRERIARWIDGCSEELREPLEWQFLTGSKYFRPLTIFSCYRALREGPIPEQIMQSALVIHQVRRTIGFDDFGLHRGGGLSAAEG